MRIILSILIFVCSSSFSAILGPAWLAASTQPPVISFSPITNIVTDASPTPSTNIITLANGANAVRILTGELAYTSSGGYIVYVSDNGLVTPIRMYNWQGRIYSTTNKANLSFGTDNGLTIQVAPLTVPATLPVATAESGTANIDRAGPPLWSPANAHVTLANYNSAFQIDSNASEVVVFVSEYDGTTWTWPRWYWVQSNYNLTIQCNYKQIALSSYGGQPISVHAPVGSTIGGTSNYMTFGLPAVTGTTRNVTNGWQLLDAFTNAVSGDRIVLWEGPIYITNNVITNMFVANYAAGKRALEGITITSGEPTNIIVSGSDTNFGSWSLVMSGATSTSCIANLTFDYAATATGKAMTNKQPMFFQGGRWRFEHVTWRGATVASGGNLLQTSASSSSPLFADFLWCMAYNAMEDCFDSTGDATYGATSKVRHIGSIATNCGNVTGSQCFTGHTQLTNYLYGCLASDSYQDLIANGTELERTFANFCNLDAGYRKGQCQQASLFCCTLTNGTGQVILSTNHYALFNSFVGTNFGAATDWHGSSLNNVYLGHNRYTANNGRVFHPTGNRQWLIGNICDGSFGQLVRIADYSASRVATNFVLMNNTFANAATVLYIYQDSLSNTMSHITNNACLGNTTGADVSVAARTNIFADFNVVDPTVSTNYLTVCGSSDITNANAAITANWFPTAAGNCDGNGKTNMYGWEADSDPYGFVLIYSRTRASRGAREIPAIYVGARIYPDVW